jgi:hypothetical protein
VNGIASAVGVAVAQITVPSNPGGLGTGPIQTTPFQGGGSSSTTVTSGGSVSSLAGGLLELLAVLVVLGLVGVFVIIVVANRADPDPTGRRPQSVYFFAVSFVSITTAIIGSAVVVGALIQLVGSHSSSITNPVARAVVAGGLITLVSLVLLVSHLQRGLSLTRTSGESPNPSRRVGQSYVAIAAFVAIVSILATAVLSVYLLFAIAGPGVFGSFGGRGTAGRILVETVYLGLVAVLVLLTHRNLVPPGIRIFGKGPDPVGPAVPPHLGMPPSASAASPSSNPPTL